MTNLDFDQYLKDDINTKITLEKDTVNLYKRSKAKEKIYRLILICFSITFVLLLINRVIRTYVPSISILIYILIIINVIDDSYYIFVRFKEFNSRDINDYDSYDTENKNLNIL